MCEVSILDYDSDSVCVCVVKRFVQEENTDEFQFLLLFNLNYYAMSSCRPTKFKIHYFVVCFFLLVLCLAFTHKLSNFNVPPITNFQHQMA